MSTTTVTQIKTSKPLVPRLWSINGNKTRKKNSVVLRLLPVNDNKPRKNNGHVLDPNHLSIINNSGNSPKTRRNIGTLLTQLENSNLMPIYFPGKVGDFEDWREYFQDSLENIPLQDIILSSIHASNIIPSYDSYEFMKEYSEFINNPELNLLKDTFNLMPSKSERRTVGGEFNDMKNNDIEEKFQKITLENVTHYTNAQQHANTILTYLQNIHEAKQHGMLSGFISNDTKTKVKPLDICKNLLWFINISSSPHYTHNTNMYSQFILHFYFGLKLKGTIDGVNIQLTKADKEEIPDDTKLTYTIKQYTDDIKKPLFSGDNVIKAVTIAKIIGFATRSMSDIIQVITKDHIDKFRRKEHLEFYCISALNQILCYLVQDESIFYLFLTFLSHIASDEFFKKDYFSEMIYPAKYSLYTLVPRSHVLYEQIREVKDYFKINDDILNCGVFFNFREASSEGDNLTSSKIYKILDLQSIHEYTYFINTLVRMIFKKPKIMSLVPSIRHKPLYEKINDDEPLYSVYTNEVTSYSCKDLRVINSDKWKETKLAVATGEEVREEDVAVAVPLGETLSICNRWVAETREQQFRTLSNPRVTDSTTELCAILSRLVYCDTSVIQEFFKDDSNIKYLMPLDPDPEWLGNYPNVIKHRIHVFYKKENPSTETPISVFIVFRGSLTSRDWFETNVDITLASKRGASFNHRIINFPVFIKRITDNIKRIIIKKMNLRYASVKFYSTGHSLGGYLALMLSSYSYSLIISNEAPDAFVSTRLNSTRSKIKYYKAIEPIVFNPFGGTLNRPGKALVTIYYPDSHFYRDAFTSYLEIIRSGQVHRIRSGPRGRNSFYDIASSPIAASIYNTSLQLIEYQNIYDSNNKKELTTIDGLTLDDNFNYAQSHAMYQFIGLVSFYIDSLTLKGNSERIYSSDPIQDIISIKPFKEDITLSTNINLVLLELNDKYKFLSNTFWANLRRMVNPGPLSPSSPYSQVYAQGGRIRTRSLRSTRKSKLLHSPYSVSRKRRVSSL